MKGILPYLAATVALGLLVFMGGSSLGDNIASNAEAAVGMGAGVDATAFGDLLGGPGETDIMKQSMALSPASSTCGLAVRAFWRQAGVQDPNLSAPYHIGTVISDMIAYATAKGAWVTATPGLWPKRGSMVAIGPSGGGITHVYTSTSVDPSSGNVTSVDGGMTDANGAQMIGSHTRTWTVEGSSIVDAPNGSIARVVYGWTDPDLLS